MFHLQAHRNRLQTGHTLSNNGGIYVQVEANGQAMDGILHGSFIGKGDKEVAFLLQIGVSDVCALAFVRYFANNERAFVFRARPCELITCKGSLAHAFGNDRIVGIVNKYVGVFEQA